MKLSAWAKRMGITYKTAWRWFKEGKIEGAFKSPSGSIFVPDEVKKEDYVVFMPVYLHRRIKPSSMLKPKD